jgi:hypothetical protein
MYYTFNFKVKLVRNICGIESSLEIVINTNTNDEVDLENIINQAVQQYYLGWKVLERTII